MTIAYACVLFMGLFPYVAAGIAKKGFDQYDNWPPTRSIVWLLGLICVVTIFFQI